MKWSRYLQRTQTEGFYMKNFKEELDNLPEKPGVYIMKDINNTVLYVGKAISLKRRVRQYFSSSVKTPKIIRLVELIDRFEYIVTDNEVEALVLECNLIKKYRPKFNVLLKDDKNYPHIKITIDEDFPRVLTTRKLAKDGALYFGPYTNMGAFYEMVDTLKRLFPIRTCNKPIIHQRIERPCLNYHIKRCSGPCRGVGSKEAYQEVVQNVIDFLKGRYQTVMEHLQTQMLQAAERMAFEEAAMYRDKIKSIRQLNEKQKVLSKDFKDRDVIAFVGDAFLLCVEVFYVRSGKLMGKRSFFIDRETEEDAATFNAFVKQFYLDADTLPEELVLIEEIEDKALLEGMLSQKVGKKIRILTPQKGEKWDLLQMVKTNAQISLENHQQELQKREGLAKARMLQLMEKLSLEQLPDRIEAFDISNTGSTEMVGSMVVFQEALPAKSQYRRFKIKDVQFQDDYACMQEVLRRRCKRIRKEDLNLPKLFLVDGGKTHVSVAKKVLAEFALNIPVYGMVKDDKHRTRSLVDEEQEFYLKDDREIYQWIASIQDEVHRFAIAYNHLLRSKRTKKSVLDSIVGVGPKTKKNLLKHFGSVSQIKIASYEQLVEVEGLNHKTAREVFDYFHR